MKICEDKDYCYIEMSYCYIEIGASIKYHRGVKSMRAPYAIFADLKKWIHALMILINNQPHN